jgi:exodeoxyribonuclease V beta subunit
LDDTWRRFSYSAITAFAHDAAARPDVDAEPETSVIDDEMPFDADMPALPGTPSQAEPPLLLTTMPGGVAVGTVVHRVLEASDFTASDLEDQLRAALQAQLSGRNLDLGDLDVLVAGLRTAIEAPLGPIADGIALRTIERSDRRDELGFELPVVGGDAPTGTLSVRDIAALLRRHLQPDDPLSGYAERLTDPSLNHVLRGFLAGSLDLVFRRSGDRFYIVDYKTNRLAPAGETLTAWHYGPTALREEMYRAHYPLQALLYTLALHRYLRWRLPDYQPDRHLAGVLYLFVRGMSSQGHLPPNVAAPGVWAWRPPASLITVLSDFFDHGRPAE